MIIQANLTDNQRFIKTYINKMENSSQEKTLKPKEVVFSGKIAHFIPPDERENAVHVIRSVFCKSRFNLHKFKKNAKILLKKHEKKEKILFSPVNSILAEIKPYHADSLKKLLEEKISNKKRFKTFQIYHIIKALKPSNKYLLEILLNVKDLKGKKLFNYKEIASVLKNQGLIFNKLRNAKASNGLDRFKPNETAEILKECKSQFHETALSQLLDAKNARGKDRFRLFEMTEILRACSPQFHETALSQLIDAKDLKGDNRFMSYEIAEILKEHNLESHKDTLFKLLNAKDYKGEHLFNSSGIRDILKAWTPEHPKILDKFLAIKLKKNQSFLLDNPEKILCAYKQGQSILLDRLVRLDSGFSTPQIVKFLNKHNPKNEELLEILLAEKNSKGKGLFNMQEIKSLLKEFKTLDFNMQNKKKLLVSIISRYKNLAVNIQALWKGSRDRNFVKAVKKRNELFKHLEPFNKLRIELRRTQDLINGIKLKKANYKDTPIFKTLAISEKELQALSLDNLYAQKTQLKNELKTKAPNVKEAVQSAEAKAQSKKYMINKFISADEKLINGFEVPSNLFNNGDNYVGERIIIDFNNDKALQQIIFECRAMLARNPNFSDENKLKLIMKKTAVVFSKVGIKHLKDGLSGRIFSGMNVPLGFQIEMGAGVCRHRALLVKILADDAGLKVELNTGYAKTLGAHAWNTFYFDGKKYYADAMLKPDKLLLFEQHQDYYSDFK